MTCQIVLKIYFMKNYLNGWKMKKITLILLIITFAGCSEHIDYNLKKAPTRRVESGLENFLKNDVRNYRGKKALLITNHSGVNYSLEQNIWLLRESGIEISTVLAPEHGIFGAEAEYDNKTYEDDALLNLQIYNIHMLRKNDVATLAKAHDLVIYDIQDLGMRCYTYVSVLIKVMEALDNLPTELIVFDRPNPLAFLGVDGEILNPKYKSQHIGAFPGSFLYDFTSGECALYYKGEFTHNVNLKISKTTGWARNEMFNKTGLPWVPPSPNLPTYESAIVYAAVELLEGVNISLGRGTPKPFEYIGAPWIEPYSFAAGLNKLSLKNFRFRPVYFKPTYSWYKDQNCAGVQIFYIGGKFSPTEVAYKITTFIKENYPEKFAWKNYDKTYDIDYLTGNNRFRSSIESGASFNSYYSLIKDDTKKYDKIHRKYLLY